MDCNTGGSLNLAHNFCLCICSALGVFSSLQIVEENIFLGLLLKMAEMQTVKKVAL